MGDSLQMNIPFAALSSRYQHFFDPFKILFLTNVVIISCHLLHENSHCILDLIRIFLPTIQEVKEPQQNFHVSIVHL